jgi:hypothetical protein
VNQPQLGNTNYVAFARCNIETHLPTIYAQPRILFNQDPANQHIEPGRFIGFFDYVSSAA